MKPALSFLVLLITGWLAYGLMFSTTPQVYLVFLDYLLWLMAIGCWVYLVVYFLTNEKVKGEFEVRQLKRAFKWQAVWPAITFYAIFFKNSSITNLVVALSFWIIPIVEASYCIRVAMYKPVGLVIEGNFLYINSIRLRRRDVRNLWYIDIIGKKNIVELSFEKQPKIAFTADEFGKDDLQALINLAISKSNHQITIPAGLKYLLDIKEPLVV